MVIMVDYQLCARCSLPLDCMRVLVIRAGRELGLEIFEAEIVCPQLLALTAGALASVGNLVRTKVVVFVKKRAIYDHEQR